MSPSTGVLKWMAAHARQLGIMVRQVEDEIGVMNMVIGAAHAGCRAMCATSGGGFALMTEALGMAGMIEMPVVCIDVQRAGPATGVPTKTEQGDLWQMLGAGQGDYPRIIVAPTSQLDLFQTIPELFNLCDRFQCPGIVLSDLLISEGTSSIDPDDLDFNVQIDRGELILPNGNGERRKRSAAVTTTRPTCATRSPRAASRRAPFPAFPATSSHRRHRRARRRRQLDQRRVHQPAQAPHDGRKARAQNAGVRSTTSPPPKLFGPANAAVTLVGWGSTEGVIREAVEKLAGEEGIVANHLQIKWLVPLHADEISRILCRSKNVIIVENNYSGQFARYCGAKPASTPHGHIRKYDGEPFMPHHIVEAVKDQLAGKTQLSVPVHEILV